MAESPGARPKAVADPPAAGLGDRGSSAGRIAALMTGWAGTDETPFWYA